MNAEKINDQVRSLARKTLPFNWRVELRRLPRALSDLRDMNLMARQKGEESEFPWLLFQDSSPLRRFSDRIPRDLQLGKERNLAVACQAIDRTVIEPGQIFSYHRLVGRPSRPRGFRPGLELHDSEQSAGTGGGLCLISNIIYWLALNSGMIIRERHRHSFDLFPDHNRSRPFGCGATVFYNYHDLRFENPLAARVMVRLEIVEDGLEARMLADDDAGYEVRILERGHRFFEDEGVKTRENYIWRQIRNKSGTLIREELVAHNLCRVMY